MNNGISYSYIDYNTNNDISASILIQNLNTNEIQMNPIINYYDDINYHDNINRYEDEDESEGDSISEDKYKYKEGIEYFCRILKCEIVNFNRHEYYDNKEYYLIDKITTINKKFVYFNLKTILKNDIYVYLFYRAQRLYIALVNFVNKLRIRKAKVYNDEDLLGDKINTRSFNVLYNNFIYKFRPYSQASRHSSCCSI